MTFTQYVSGRTVNKKVLGQWDPYSCENLLSCSEARIGEWEGYDDDNDDGDNREAGYFQKMYESLN